VGDEEWALYRVSNVRLLRVTNMSPAIDQKC
jgi:hypothetical protein